MNRTVRILALVAVVLAASGGAYAYTMWSRATALPQWYATPTPEVSPSVAPRAAFAPTWQPIASPDHAPTFEIRDVHRKSPQLKRAGYVRASRATLHDQTFEGGVVLNIGELKAAAKRPDEQRMLQRVLSAFDSLNAHEVYVGVKDTIKTQDGIVQLGPSATLVIGELEYPLATVAKRLNRAPTQLLLELNRELRHLHLTAPAAKAP